MKHTIKRAISLFLAIIMCLCTTAFAAAPEEVTSVASSQEVIENVTFFRGVKPRLPASGSQTVYLSKQPTILGYTVLPLNGNTPSGTVKVTITQYNGEIGYTLTLTADGQYHAVSISNWYLSATNTTVRYSNSTIPLNSISITFGR